MAVRGVHPGLPLPLTLGVGLCTAALAVTYRDVGHILLVLAQFMFYASPVAYKLCL